MMATGINVETHSPLQKELIDICGVSFKNDYSDIHLEPNENEVIVRVRKNGVLKTYKRINNKRAKIFIEKAKNLLGFSPKVGVPQDSRFSHPYLPVDFRCNIMPMKWGEKICMRTLERNKKFHLAKYPLKQKTKDELGRVVQRGSGIILISGPTGSGKSTLLYSILGSINDDQTNINTIEDPIEYAIDGVNQVQINAEHCGFGDAIRGLMRQDPDVIMVGEIRDEETAKAAIHAASTGHLVLSTVHANDALDIFNRLESLNIARESIEQVLQFGSSQRLVKILCGNCKKKDNAGKKSLKHLFNDVDEFTPMIAEGCLFCSDTGYIGRKLVLEYVSPLKIQNKKVMTINEPVDGQILTLLKNGVIDVKEAFSCISN